MESHAWCLQVFVYSLAVLQVYGQGGRFDLSQVQIRLAGGINDREGRVEVFYNNSWGTICDDSFDVQDAAVICRQIGIVGLARAFVGSFFGRGSGRIWMDELSCSGNEPVITDCPFDGWGNNDCQADHAEDAGVSCLGERVTTTTTTPKPTTTTSPPPRICNTPSDNVRLIGGRNEAEGRVEVRQTAAGVWGEICDDRWGVQDAQVICRQLCYHPNNARAHLGPSFGNASRGFLLDEVRCTGSESDIFDCTHTGIGVHNCDVTEAAGVSCIQETPTPPPLPTPDILCTEEQITARFSRDYEPSLRRTHLSVAGANASCNYTTSLDANYVSISIPFTKCGTQRELNLTHISYRNTVRHAVPPPDPLITRTEVYLVPVYCVFFRNGDSVNEVEPEGRTAPPVAGDGKFDVKMFLYRSDSFQTPIQSFPAPVALGAFLFVGISLTTSDPELKLTVPQCYTSTSTTPDTDPMYYLLKNKCRVEPSLTFYPVNETMFAFRFQSFRFIGNYSYLYLHCKALVCEMDEKDGWCDRTCIPGAPDDAPNRKRGKRDVSLAGSFMDDSGHTIYNMERGPLYIAEPGGGAVVPEVIPTSGRATGAPPLTSRIVTDRSTARPDASKSPSPQKVVTPNDPTRREPTKGDHDSATQASAGKSSARPNDTPKNPPSGIGPGDDTAAEEIKDDQTGTSSSLQVTFGILIMSLLALLLH